MSDFDEVNVMTNPEKHGLNIAVVLAGGSGQRFGAAIPKQFLPLAGRTVIEYSVEAFENCEDIDEIAVVMHPDYLAQMQAIIDKNGWKKVKKLLPGGMEAFQVFITAGHHALIDVPNPDWMRHDEGQSHHTHEDIGVCQTY